MELNKNYLKNVLTLMKGTTVAQILPILISPLLTRLYPPQEFGVLAIYIAIISILTPIINGRYELAILLPESQKKAYSLFILTLIINILITILISIIIFIGLDVIIKTFKLEDINNWIWFIPAGIFLTGLYNSLVYLNNRFQRFNYLAKAKINQSLSMGTAQLLFGVLKFGYFGLIIGYVLGQIISIVKLKSNFNFLLQIKVNNIQKKDLKDVALEYKEFPKYAMVTHFTESFAANLPHIMLSKLFGTQYVGYYSLTTRTISLPLSLIGKAVGDVFLSTASKQYREQGNCEQLYKKTFKILAFIPLIPFIVLFLFAEKIFIFVFGAEWGIAGEYTKLLIPALYLQFISSPLSHMFVIAKKVKTEFFIQIVILLLSVCSFGLGYYIFNSHRMSVMMYSAVLTLKYLTFILYSYKFSKN